MSSLKRYKKQGGFVQLLSLIETFGGPKKAKFLEMIEAEDTAWASMLKEKMLTIERIYAWPDQVILEILKAMPVAQIAWVLEGMEPVNKDRMTPFFSGAEMRRFADIIAEKKDRKPENISSNQVRMLELARKMLTDRSIAADKFDSTLAIPEGIEAKLDELSDKKKHAEPSVLDLHVFGKETAHAPTASSNDTASAEFQALKKTVALLVKKNQELSAENRVLKEKLEQIRRVA